MAAGSPTCLVSARLSKSGSRSVVSFVRSSNVRAASSTENIAYGAEGREIAIFDQADFHLVDMRLVEIVELAPAPKD
jgi:hypothetical protein